MPDIELESLKKSSTAQMLMRCARLMNDAGIAGFHQRFGLPIRPAHTQVFPHIDFAGTRLTEIAKRMRISKQAVSQLVLELEEMGLVERIPDPQDGRAKLVCFAANKMREGLSVLLDLERELSEEIGAEEMANLKRILSLLLPVLEATQPR